MDLAEELAREIRSHGPLPFHRFMEAALYHPGRGYYASGRNPFGTEGDFFTNAQLQPVFGRLIAQQLSRWRQQLDGTDRFTVVELGPGRGETASEVLRWMPEIEWLPVERHDPWPRRAVTGVVFCNEFFDALPVDLVERRGDRWVEWGVDFDGGRFVWGRTGRRLRPRGLPGIGDGRRIETCQLQVDVIRRLGGLLDRGWVLVVDYGYTRDEVERGGRFPEGSLMGYRGHLADPDVLADPGSRDITAHVNFSALEDAALDAGFAVEPLQTQQAFLLDIGKVDDFASALAADSERRARELRLQLKTLLFGIGETFRVLRLYKEGP